jgi:hypothetical protein
MLTFAIVAVVVVLALIFTPLLPRKFMGRQYLEKKLRNLGVIYVVPKECLKEFVERSHALAKFVSSIPGYSKGFHQSFAEDLDVTARFIQVWTLKSATGEAFRGDDWSELVGIAEKHGIPRGT